jgi:uncharacterized protein (DUF305 family)
MLKTLALAVCAAAVLATGAYAQNMSPADKEYMAAMDKMNKEMMAATDPDPTRSFAKKMAVHHQGAIDMAKIVQKHTKYEHILAMTKKMIPEQEKEIKDLKEWVAKH